MTGKLRIAVLFGGRSAEHEVSLMSARNAVAALDRTRYEIVPIGIARDGRWMLVDLEDGELPKAIPVSGTQVALIPGGRGRAVTIAADGRQGLLPAIDLIFPVLHGPFGEDGTVQGYAETADVAYVGCGVAASAVAMDKALAKRLLVAEGIAVARAIGLHAGDAYSSETILESLGLPVFVKPARQGSSVGVSRVDSLDALQAALNEAFRHDDKVLIEEFVQAREIECSVLEDAKGQLTVSRPGEIIPAASHGFYSYDAKYVDAGGAVVEAPAKLSEEVIAEAKDMAARAFRALDCAGMARVDFFLRADGSLMINEINTIPGFTNISMYAKALAADGIAYGQVVETLIAHALKLRGKAGART
ncbi:D-alanine--D-alanine ligase [Ensifer sp. ENS07]|jgi:D-alanine-D-alanine ligase|uniref:D-alanine--D-alanine ligase n=1 Tax=Ensifer adhaerens TaxID=106592 RepID=A0A9Q8YC57_ENSAD|nr:MULTISPECIES: D-alanine--D-alanine ligase family protein [Ensifer]OWZ94555.1 D-alanine--D-alanine ligase A [Sinorhizobium sp. LM21]ANK72800.1 D-alanine--D-alanine ligase A [Ensifer adhaerens]KDP75374.1 D-alanine--D-alanine ligase [Ensifer adhaerens]KQX32824.1 D-alanine--D-alanine ligase [Ensifer sp. Root423]KQZ58390.1 D-alanine--D-alanine ligase [Ensifer sp. Root558]